jgi:hypothetical protein
VQQEVQSWRITQQHRSVREPRRWCLFKSAGEVRRVGVNEAAAELYWQASGIYCLHRFSYPNEQIVDASQSI